MSGMDEVIKKEFEKEIDRISLFRFRIACTVGLILIPAFILLDKYTAGELFDFFVYLRLYEILFIFLLFLLSFTKFGTKLQTVLGFSGFLSVSVVFNIMIYHTGGHTSTYYNGLQIAVLGLMLLMPWGIKRVAFVCAGIYSMYLIAIWGDITDKRLLINNNMFLLSTMFVAIWASYLNNKLRFEQFSSNYSLEQANQKLRELDVMKNRFFSNISHELRTPITLNIAPVEAMLKGAMGPVTVKQSDYMKIMHTNLLRLLKLINNLLDLTRLGEGRSLDMSMSKADFGEFTAGLCRSVMPYAEQKAITLTTAIEPAGKDIFFDAEKLERVILNILSNALKFTGTGGTIAVRVWRDGDLIRTRISDTGSGIPEDKLEAVFERFVQASGQHKTYGGTGIGLALAKEFVEMHGGTIKAENNTPRGVSIEFSLPLEQAQTGAAQEKVCASSDNNGITAEHSYRYMDLDDQAKPLVLSVAQKAEDTDQTNKHTVLVVEDNPDMRRLLTDILSQDYRVIHASNGVYGLTAAREEKPDLIISDIMMPEKDGYALCSELKNDTVLSAVPVIFLTAKGDQECKAEGFACGADDYIIKPFTEKELLGQVKNLLRLRDLERELLNVEKMASLGVLMSGLTHELNNPVGYMGSCLRVIEKYMPKIEDDILKKDFTDMLTYLNDGLTKIQSIIRGVSAFARNVPDTEGEYPVQTLLDGAVRMVGFKKPRDIELRVDCRDSGTLICSYVQMQQVIINLLTNAFDALGSAGRVELAAERKDSSVQITVTDNGPGIPDADVERIFKPFYSTKTGGASAGSGMGLGLSICAQIIESHNGTISVTSRNGSGTCFCISLPVV